MVLFEIETVPVITVSFNTFWLEKIASVVMALLKIKSMVFTPVRNAVFFPEMVTGNDCPPTALFGKIETLWANELNPKKIKIKIVKNLVFITLYFI